MNLDTMLDDMRNFYTNPIYSAMHQTDDMDLKMSLAADLHGGDVPWKGEPHRKEWKHKGLDCLIVRNDLGALCGYAAVPKGHPYYGAHYDKPEVDVHGGLTYANACQGKVCHVTETEDEVWWLGFDCAHAYDWIPCTKRGPVEQYRDIEYVTRHVNALAEQILKAGGTHE